MQSDYSKREAKAVNALKKAIPAGMKSNVLKQSKGFFCELSKTPFPSDYYLASAVDSAGTKTILATALNKYDSIGIDCVAMNSNDLCTLPNVKPFLFINYLAVQKQIQQKSLTKQIMKGIVKGLKESDCAKILNIGKGETASLDEMIDSPKKGYGFDLAGMMMGFVEKNKTNFSVKPGMKIVAFKSSGAHSNGFTDLRLNLLKGEFEERKQFKKQYKGKLKLNQKMPNGHGETIGSALLKPTKIYSKLMYDLGKKTNAIGINITGYGLKNFNRIGKKVEFHLHNVFKPQPVFELMQKESKYSDEQMYQKFNMGNGFFAIVNKKDEETALKLAKKHKILALVSGEIKKSKQVKPKTVLHLNGKKLVFQNY